MIEAQLLAPMPDPYHYHVPVKPDVRSYHTDDIYSLTSSMFSADQFYADYVRVSMASDVQRPSVIRDVQTDRYDDTDGETCDGDSDEDFMDDVTDLDEEDDARPDDPSQMLTFVCSVTSDIQKLFSRNKDAEDYCDVYEERFKSTLSGRELYYADLLALATNGDAAAGGRKRGRKSATPPASFSSASAASSPEEPRVPEHTVVYAASGEATQCTLPHEGLCVAAYGLGPLEELFKKGGSGATSWKTSDCFKSFNNSGDWCAAAPVPMTMRKLPNSFWEEPRAGLAVEGGAPDFNDLVTNWAA